MKTINDDILNVKQGIVVHQVNCMGVMGSGLALKVKNKYPENFRRYYAYCETYDYSKTLLGNVLFTFVDDGLLVANLFGQLNYGHDKVYTNYDAHRKAWGIIKRIGNYNYPVFAPWMIGCGLGGGDWRIVKEIVEDIIPDITWVKFQK